MWVCNALFSITNQTTNDITIRSKMVIINPNDWKLVLTNLKLLPTWSNFFVIINPTCCNYKFSKEGLKK